MDKQLLDALNNLSLALEEISTALNNKSNNSSATTTALQGGDLSSRFNEIDISLKSIKSDTQEILKQQKTILSMSKNGDKTDKTDKTDKDSKSTFQKAGGSKKEESNLKKGVGTIMLIAIAVLAIGMAFKIIGKVDFLSVISISLSLLMISLAFEKVAKLDLSIRDAFRTSLVIVIMAVAITLSSWVLSMIKPVSFANIITAVAIAALFYVLSDKIAGLMLGVMAFHRLKVSPIKLVLALVAISTGIMASSWVLSMVKPISLPQAITSILIAAMFSVISYNLHKIAAGVVAFDKFNINPTELVKTLVGIAVAIVASSWVLSMINPLSLGQLVTGILIAAMFTVISFNIEKIAAGVIAFKKTGVKPKDLLLVLVGIAAAITVSSWVLSMIEPIGFTQFLTALGIAILFAVISYVMPELGVGIMAVEKAVGVSKLWVIPLVFVAIALAITLSSYILAEAKQLELGFILSVAIFGIALAVMTLVMLPSILLVGLVAASGVGAGAILLGVALIPLIALAITLSSHILSEGKYKKFPSLGWSLGVGLSLLSFSLAVVALGAIALTGIGLVAILAGTLLVPLIAQTIVDTDLIISKGKYNKYPGLGWIFSVGTLMVGFGIAVVALGAIALTGIGLVAILAGTLLVPLIAQTIVDTDRIISKGKYNKYPGLEWALSVGSLMTVFGLSIIIIGSFIVGTLGLGGLAMKVGSKAVTGIAQTIVDVAWIFKKASGAFVGGPSKDWAEGVGIAIGAFAPVYRMLMTGGIMKAFGIGGVTADDFSKAIKTISDGIVYSATQFKGLDGSNFTGGPSKDWAEGVGKAIGAFAPVYSILSKEKGFLGTGISIESFVSAIKTISHGIIESAVIFKGSKVGFGEGTYPTVDWAKGVGGAIGAFAPVFKSLSGAGWTESGKDVIDNMVNGVVRIAKTIVRVGRIFAWSKVEFGESSVPGRNWNFKMSNAVKSFVNLTKNNFAGIYNKSVEYIARKIVKIAKIMDGGRKFFVPIDPDFMKNIGSNISYYMKIINKLNDNNNMGKMAKNMIFGDPITNIANGMIKLAGAYDVMTKSLLKFGSALSLLDSGKLKTFSSISKSVININDKSGSSINDKSGNKNSIISKAGMSTYGVNVNNGNYKETSNKKNDNLSAKMDKVISLLSILTKSTKSLDTFIMEKLSDDGKDKIKK